MLLFLQLFFGFLQLLLDLLHVFVHLPDGRVEDLPDEKSEGGKESSSRAEIQLCAFKLMSLVSPGELVSHVLREEPVGDGGAVHNLRANHFIHQNGDHLENAAAVKSTIQPHEHPHGTAARRLYLRVVPPRFVHHFEDVQLPFITFCQSFQDLMEPGNTRRRCSAGLDSFTHCKSRLSEDGGFKH